MMYYLMIESEMSDIFTTVLLDWTKLPKDVVEKLPSTYFLNVLGANSDGSVIEKTVVCVEPIDEGSPTIDDDYAWFSLDENIKVCYLDFDDDNEEEGDL